MREHDRECEYEILPMSRKLFARAVETVVQGGFPNEVFEQALLERRAEGDAWIHKHHFYWGMSFRNWLRKHVCLDDVLPTHNWDDYYVSVFHAALERWSKEQRA